MIACKYLHLLHNDAVVCHRCSNGVCQCQLTWCGVFDVIKCLIFVWHLDQTNFVPLGIHGDVAENVYFEDTSFNSHRISLSLLFITKLVYICYNLLLNLLKCCGNVKYSEFFGL